jgi:lysine 2,3-aminomutase
MAIEIENRNSRPPAAPPAPPAPGEPFGPFAGVSPQEWDDWRWQVRHRIVSHPQLLAALELEPAAAPAPSPELLARFPLGVTPYYLSLAARRRLDDPIALQVLPREDEGHDAALESADPFHEDAHSPLPGVIHRYPDRALILPTDFCATLCRHCFRKRAWSDGFSFLTREQLRAAVDYVRSQPGVRDVLITGGDPLHLNVSMLDALLADLKSVPHVEVVRIATRTPVTLPQRIDVPLLDALAAHRPLWLVTHFNHAVELSPAARRALRALIDRGISVLNQTVLLRGVNDEVAAQVDLARALVAIGVRPYYLHLADPVSGASHFRVGIERARSIVAAMHGLVTGFAIPRLVLDLPGGKGKVPLDLGFERGGDGDARNFRSPIDGTSTLYLDAGEGPRSRGGS